MPIDVERITVDALTCAECDCGTCLTAAAQLIEAMDGVVYVGVDRRRPAFVVRYERAIADPHAMRAAVADVGLTLT